MTFWSTTNGLLLTDADVRQRPPANGGRVFRKLRAFATLPVGWSFGAGLPVATTAIAVAERVISLAESLELRTDVFANLDGGCAVALYRDDDKFEVNVSADGRRFGVSAERGIGFPFDVLIEPLEDLPVAELSTRLMAIIDHPWKSFEYSISGSSTAMSAGSETWYTRIPLSRPERRLHQTATGGSQSSRPPVLVKVA